MHGTTRIKFTNRINAIFRIVVEFVPLQYITPKLTYVMPSTTTKFYCFVNICYMFRLCRPSSGI